MSAIVSTPVPCHLYDLERFQVLLQLFEAHRVVEADIKSAHLSGNSLRCFCFIERSLFCKSDQKEAISKLQPYFTIDKLHVVKGAGLLLITM